MMIKKIVNGVEIEVEETAEEKAAREGTSPKPDVKTPEGGSKEDDSDDDDDDTDDGKEMISISKKKFNKREQKIQELQEQLNGRNSNTPADVKALAEKYKLDEGFVSDMVTLSKAQAKEDLKGEISPIVRRHEEEKRNEGFNKAFEEETMMHPALIEKKEQLRSLSFQSNNANKTILEIAQEFYPEAVGRKSSESDTSRFSDKDLETIDFGRMSEAQRTLVLKNPQARDKYYAWADKNGL